MNIFKNKENDLYSNCECITLIKEIDHQNIGGKKAYIQFEISVKEIMEKAEYESNWACCNFIDRRKDLFEMLIDPKDKRPHTDHIVYIGSNNLKFYYVKIYTNPEHLKRKYTWLGYIISSDEDKNNYFKE